MVTGGARFIGSNLAEELVKENGVLILDDLSTGRMENIKELVEKANVKFIRGSITDLHFLQKSFSNIDYVFHLAAIPSVPENIKDPISSNNVNINGTLNVLIAARDNQIKKVVYVSSCAVYGDATIMPIAEIATLNPKSPYAVTKLAGEYYCSVFSEVYNLPTTSLRYFNVYRPLQPPNSEYAAVIPKFMSKILADRPSVIYGDCLQTRDFVFVKDVVRANILAAESRETEVFNIGSGVSMIITELSKTIMDILDKDLKPLHDGPREGEIMHSYVDISMAKLLGYLLEYSLEDGLRELMGWFKTGLSEKFANI